METIKAIVQFFVQEGAVIANAPVTFLVALCAIGYVMWRILGAIRGGEIRGLRANMEAKESHIALFRDKVANAERQLEHAGREIESLRFQVNQLPVGEVKFRALESSSSISDSLSTAADILRDLEEYEKRSAAPDPDTADDSI